MCCALKSLNRLKLKVRTEFPNVWGEYKYHGNPYIQGTTVPCDIYTLYMSAVQCSQNYKNHRTVVMVCTGRSDCEYMYKLMVRKYT